MKINRIDVISIPVSDQAAAKAYYSEKLGFEVVSDNPMGPDQRWVQLRPSGAETSITLVTWFDNMPPGSAHGMVLDTDDVADTYATLRERGIATTDLEDQPWGKFFTFRDPDGNGWVVQERAK